MCDEDFDYGVVYFGDSQPVENTAEKIAAPGEPCKPDAHRAH